MNAHSTFNYETELKAIHERLAVIADERDSDALDGVCDALSDAIGDERERDAILAETSDRIVPRGVWAAKARQTARLTDAGAVA